MTARSLLDVIVKPASRSIGITLKDGTVEVRVAAPARDGLANEAVRSALAQVLECPRSCVTLVRGAKGALERLAARSKQSNS